VDKKGEAGWAKPRGRLKEGAEIEWKNHEQEINHNERKKFSVKEMKGGKTKTVPNQGRKSSEMKDPMQNSQRYRGKSREEVQARTMI